MAHTHGVDVDADVDVDVDVEHRDRWLQLWLCGWQHRACGRVLWYVPTSEIARASRLYLYWCCSCTAPSRVPPEPDLRPSSGCVCFRLLCSILDYAGLCCGVLWCVLCCAMLCCAVLCCCAACGVESQLHLVVYMCGRVGPEGYEDAALRTCASAASFMLILLV